MRQWRRRFITGMVAVAVMPALALGATPAWSATGPLAEPIPEDQLAQDYEVPTARGVAEGLQRATGTVEVTVRLAEPAIAEVVDEGALAKGGVPSKGAQREKKNAVAAQQKGFENSARAVGATVLGSTQLAANLVVVSVDAAQLETLAALPNVISINPMNRYETHNSAEEVESGSLAQAIDYVQARALHEAGIDGTGVRVAVLDSGIDFTHFNLGGPGTADVVNECFAGANAPVAGVCATLFGPDAPKVKGGYDFVGDGWPTTAVVTDPNPIDSGPSGGHGTHVADIIAGRSADDTHQGIAPGADLYAVKVCSAVSTSCNGVAILQGMDWSLDPNGDGDISDAVHIVNLSLGSAYGQDQDDSSFAANNLVHAGVVVVVSAGNSADRPFIVGSPSSAPNVISVAQTALPDDLQWVIEASTGTTISNAVHMAWSPVVTPPGLNDVSLVRPVDPLGCSATGFTGFAPGSIALIQRGTCNISDKAVFAQNAGAVAVIIFNNAPGDPPSFSFGSAVPVTVPTFSISQADGLALAASLATGPVTVTIDPASAIPLTNTMVGTSSRGVTVTGNRAKPDIGAPGAWLSAETGTGTEVTNFGGTSGAAPVVSGVAALLLDKFEDATPAIIKARLLNGADDTNTTPTATGFIPTPISRIGAGEVRAAASADATGVLAVPNNGGNVGLGIPSVTGTHREQVDLTITNTSGQNKRYDLATAFRDPADAAKGAVAMKITPASVNVPAGKTKTFKVHVTIDGAKLDAWPFDFAGSIGAGAALNGPEFDGWITATSGDEQLHLGWTVLPRKAADVSAPATATLDGSGSGSIELRNGSSVTAGGTEVFALTGTSGQQPASEAGSPGANSVVIDLAATGVRTADGIIEFGIATYERRTVLTYPAEFDVYIDSNNDGTDDYVLYNAELGGFGATGQSVIYVLNLATNLAAPYFYNAGGFDSSTQIFTAPMAALGITEGQTFGFSVYAYDNYFTGALTDSLEGQSFTAGEQVYASDSYVEVPARGSTQLAVSATGAAGGSSQSGLLLLHQSAAERDYSVVMIQR